MTAWITCQPIASKPWVIRVLPSLDAGAATIELYELHMNADWMSIAWDRYSSKEG
jgi:hypothetical protein